MPSPPSAVFPFPTSPFPSAFGAFLPAQNTQRQQTQRALQASQSPQAPLAWYRPDHIAFRESLGQKPFKIEPPVDGFALTGFDQVIPQGTPNPKAFEDNTLWKAQSFRRLALIFGLGFTAGFGGVWGLEKTLGLFTKSGAFTLKNQAEAVAYKAEAAVDSPAAKEAGQKAAQEAADHLSKPDSIPTDRATLWINFTDTLTALVRLFITEPEYRQALGAYAATAALGYVGDSAVQGAKEAWVRLQESQIRFHLLSTMTGIYQQSIQAKQHHDELLQAMAADNIQAILTRHLGEGQLTSEAMNRILGQVQAQTPIPQQRRFPVEPAHFESPSPAFDGQPTSSYTSILAKTRSGTPSNPALTSALRPRPLFGRGHASINPFAFDGSPPSSHGPSKLLDLGIAGGAVALGGIVRMFVSALEKVKVQRSSGKALVSEGIFTEGVENFFLLMMDRRLLVGSLLVLVLARMGKLAVNAMREVEVTRLNAQTEYQYQQYKMVDLDPSFYRIAEEEALKQRLLQLEADMPTLVHNLPDLSQRIQHIQRDISHFAAPKYYSMAPMVGLTEARA